MIPVGYYGKNKEKRIAVFRKMNRPGPPLFAEVNFCIITCPPDTLDILFSAGAFRAGEGFFFRGEGRGEACLPQRKALK
jgi:hypothetical protein